MGDLGLIPGSGRYPGEGNHTIAKDRIILKKNYFLSEFPAVSFILSDNPTQGIKLVKS